MSDGWLWFALLRIPFSTPTYLLRFPLSASSTFISNDGILLPGHTVSQLRIRQNWEAISVLHGWLKQLLFTRVADKSLARPGRKQATATKLGIYSTYSPRSSIHFLARCSNFCKTLKKKLRTLSVHPGLRGSNDLSVGRKMANVQLCFSVQGTGGTLKVPDLENRVG